MPAGTPPDRTLAEVVEIEERLGEVSEVYSVVIGETSLQFAETFAGLNQARIPGQPVERRPRPTSPTRSGRSWTRRAAP